VTVYVVSPMGFAVLRVFATADLAESFKATIDDPSLVVLTEVVTTDKHLKEERIRAALAKLSEEDRALLKL
jgi:hypothetical protein